MTVATTCPACSEGKQIELEMTTKSGEVLTLRSCMRCEARTWLADGEPVGRDDVLRLTAAKSDFTLTPSSARPARIRRR